VVERSITWAGRNRLASKEYNRNPESSEAFLYLGLIAIDIIRFSDILFLYNLKKSNV